jgi:hypothetical protein
MKRLLALAGTIALAALIAGIAIVRTSNSSRASEERGPEQGADERGLDAGAGDGASPTKSSHERAPGGTLGDLEKLGFAIKAERAGVRSAEGGVKITGPDGAQYWGDDFRVADQDGNFVLTGAVGMRQGRSSIVAMDDDLYIRIGVDGKVQCAPGRWRTEGVRR